METFARFGYAAKGFVYAAIGSLALMAAFDISGGEATDTIGALHAIAKQPFGKFLLALIAVGLIGYALWRFIQAIYDPRGKNSGFSGKLIRLGCIFSGIFYTSIAANAALLVFGSISNSDKFKEDWTATIMQQPFGRWLVGVVGAIVIGVGFWLLYQAYKVKFRPELDLRTLKHLQRKWLNNICRLGIASRGVVFVAVGFFILEAAHQYDPEKVRGLDGVLQTFAQQPLGKTFLAANALGLVSYAVYLFSLAFYRRIKTDY